MKKQLILFLTTCLLSQVMSQTPQSNCPNSNFSLGNFTDWQGYYGDFYNPAQYYGFAANRHVINSIQGVHDPNTCNGLVTIPPGETHSARLGNDNTGAEAEQLRYSLTVTPESNLFIYKYAVVLEDPSHVPENQPSFTIEVTDENGVIIDPICGYYYVYAQQGLPGWSTCGEVVWKNWTTVGLDLQPYLGENINIVFTTRDCEQTGHFGYAYLSATCGKLQMSVSYCPQALVATLTAPPGFSYLWSNGQTTQSINITNPAAGTSVSCILTAVNGCEVTINAILYPTIVNSDFSFISNCPGFPVQFNDLSTINQNSITNWIWDFGDGSSPVSNIQNPNHTFSNSGSYNVKLIAYSTEGCTDTIIKPVTVFSKPNSDFVYISNCPNDSVHFFDQTTIEQGSIINWEWDFGDGSSFVTGIQNPSHIFSNSGEYSVKLITYSSEGCSHSIIKPVVLLPKPNSDFIYTSKCVHAPISFFDLSSISQGSITNWQWDFDDGSNSLSGISNPIHIFENPGTYFVEQISYSDEGCSDTINKPVVIYPLPLIQFYQNSFLISNDSIVLCPLDSIVNLNVSDCGIVYEWSKKTEPNWSSYDQGLILSNPGMGIFVETYYLEVMNENYCIATDSIHVLWDFSGCVGINENTKIFPRIFPNPTHGLINVYFEQTTSITGIDLFNSHGKIVYSQKYNNYYSNQLELILTKYKRGIYFLRISFKNHFKILKVILN